MEVWDETEGNDDRRTRCTRSVRTRLHGWCGREAGKNGEAVRSAQSQHMLARLAADLSLTDDQVEQLKTIMTDEQSRTEQYRTKLEDLHTQMQTATANGQFDEATVRSIATQQAAAMTELIVERERGKAKTYSVLTPDQRTKFDQLRPAGPHGHPPDGGFGFAPPQ